MDLEILPLILVFMSCMNERCSSKATEPNTDSCFKMCPPGYYYASRCGADKYQCRQCQAGTFTNIENTSRTCLSCIICGMHEVVEKNCSTSSNTKCGCKQKYYRSSSGLCQRGDYCKVPENCSNCPRNNEECNKKCSVSKPATTSTTQPTTTTTSTTTATTSSSTTAAPAVEETTASQQPENPSENTKEASSILWFSYVAASATFLLLLFFLVLFCRRQFRAFIDLEIPSQKPLCKEHCCYVSSSPAMRFTYSDETSVTPLCQEQPNHPRGQTDFRQEDPLTRWPAIILYEIIKVVPLRRWKEFLRLLSVSDQQMERVELEAGLGLMEKQYTTLRLWSQRPTAHLDQIFSSLQHMDLLSCSQMLQENLEKLQLNPEER